MSIINGKVVVSNRKKADLVNDLQVMGCKSVLGVKDKGGEVEGGEGEGDEDEDSNEGGAKGKVWLYVYIDVYIC
jgi:hypothetical protein